VGKTLPTRVRFGAFQLNPETGELCGVGQSVQLGEKPLRVLLALIECDGQLVTRETLQGRLWPNNTVVDFEHGINTAIKVLRRALGDSAESAKYVETIPRRGYRLVVPVEWIEPKSDSEALESAPDEVAQPSRLEVGSVGFEGNIVSHYRVLELIGGGGMGVVYRAEDIALGRPVALKFLSEELGGDLQALDRFHREARAISVLDHPNICPIYEFGEHEGKPFIVMPLLEGKTLRDRLANAKQRSTAIPLDELLSVGIDVSCGLQAAHEKCVIHCDIKPANIFQTSDGHSKILDFGLSTVVFSTESKTLGAPTGGDSAFAEMQLTCGAVMGTVGYMSPEQVWAKELDSRTDLFSFGAVLYEMATGNQAFVGEGSRVILKSILDGNPVPATRFNSEVPMELERIINKALEKDRNLRYQSAAEIRADLTRLKRDWDQRSPAVSVMSSYSGLAPQRETAKTSLALWTAAAILIAALTSTFILYRLHRTVKLSQPVWEPLSAFSDGATQPTLSPDGKMIAFIRGPETFVSPGQIYVQVLPDGEPVQRTHDNLPKMAPAFSVDGSRIAYTAVDPKFGWNTWVVPVLGGEPHILLPNAAALTWIGNADVVFSEVKTGAHMGIVAATESRSGERDVYLPVEIAGMAHRSWVSPDHKWILISEMDHAGDWQPCLLISFDGRGKRDVAGPKNGKCTYAGWSPDGKMMYFSANAGDGFHIWRQSFPNGVPEQMTFGATDEEGIAVSPDGRSLVTSAGIRQDSVWIHDSRGDRQVSGEGFARIPGIGYGTTCGHSEFSPDGKQVFYLLSTQGSREFNSAELQRTDIASGRSESVLPGVSMREFDLSPDGDRVAYSAEDFQRKRHIWMASLDHHTPPIQLTPGEAFKPCFAAGGEVYFQVHEGSQEFVYSLGPADREPRKVSQRDLPYFAGVSPRGKTVLYGFSPLIAISEIGGISITLCTFCNSGWGPGGKFFYIRFRDVGELGGGKTVAFSLLSGHDLPDLPVSGLNSVKDFDRLKVAWTGDMTGIETFNPGSEPGIYAYTRTTIQRNLFRLRMDGSVNKSR
jgi:eukaryotic-like serine/threonine-protein kinase